MIFTMIIENIHKHKYVNYTKYSSLVKTTNKIIEDHKRSKAWWYKPSTQDTEAGLSQTLSS